MNHRSIWLHIFCFTVASKSPLGFKLVNLYHMHEVPLTWHPVPDGYLNGILVGQFVWDLHVCQRIVQKCWHVFASIYKRKNAPVVTNLQQTCSNAVPTTCQQDVFALLVPSLLTSCYKVVELSRLVINCSNNLLSSCNSTICQQVVSDNLVATW